MENIIDKGFKVEDKSNATLAQSVERRCEVPSVPRSIRGGGTISSRTELNDKARKLCDQGICISMGEARRIVINREMKNV